jgi:hypothetical protein
VNRKFNSASRVVKIYSGCAHSLAIKVLFSTFQPAGNPSDQLSKLEVKSKTRSKLSAIVLVGVKVERSCVPVGVSVLLAVAVSVTKLVGVSVVNCVGVSVTKLVGVSVLVGTEVHVSLGISVSVMGGVIALESQ